MKAALQFAVGMIFTGAVARIILVEATVGWGALGLPAAWAQAEIADDVRGQARSLDQAGRYQEAEPIYKRALAISKKVHGSVHSKTAEIINELAWLYSRLGRDPEAEPLYKEALTINEKVHGPNHPHTALSLYYLAALNDRQGHYADAESLYRRALKIQEERFGPKHPNTAGTRHNLAGVYFRQGTEESILKAEAELKLTLEINKKEFGLKDRRTALSFHALGSVHFHRCSRTETECREAEVLYKKALEVARKALPSAHPDIATYLTSLAEYYAHKRRYPEAETLYQRALEVTENSLGPQHQRTSITLVHLAKLYSSQGKLKKAYHSIQRAVDIFIKRLDMDYRENIYGTILLREFGDNYESFLSYINIANKLDILSFNSNKYLMAAWEVAQQAQKSAAAAALTRTIARFSYGDRRLAQLTRQRQDLAVQYRRLERNWTAEVAKLPTERQPRREEQWRLQLAEIYNQLNGIDAQMKRLLPDYTAFANPRPLSIAEAQTQLTEDEALVLFLDTPGLYGTEGDTFVWVVTGSDAKWLRADIGTKTLTEDVHALRCGLDAEEWAVPARQRRCARLLGLNAVPDEKAPLPFHLGKAHDLYQALLGPVEEMIAGKRLLIVPSGPLTSLPFHVLVTEKPEEDVPETFDGYRNVPWLGRRQAITVLPAVSSLAALRRQAPAERPNGRAYLAYGAPVLRGNGRCPVLKVPEQCPSPEATQVAAVGRATLRGGRGLRSASLGEVFAQGALKETVLEKVRQQCPLPDTAREIRCIAERFPKASRMIRLADDARETDLKARSESGELADYAVIHFATHGLLSGDVARIALRQGEPALVLTPPDKPADDDDDGLLMASEVARLKLNADWVVLSACNTAAGEEVGAEALSGLARAFFYAGGRTLLVSHWPVYSDAAVRLTTHAFAELGRDGEAGRAEALQRAMVALMDDPTQADNAHPAVWAPFVVVGEGGRR